ncbi:MAG: hypothetical protein ACQEWF_23390 [Bacillota bacterium]
MNIKSINEQIPLNEDLEVFLFERLGIKVLNIEQSISPSPISETIKLDSQTSGEIIIKFNLKSFPNESLFYKLINNNLCIIPYCFKVIETDNYSMIILRKEEGGNGNDLIDRFQNSRKLIFNWLNTIEHFYNDTNSIKKTFNSVPYLAQSDIYFQNCLLKINNVLQDYFPCCLSHGDFLPFNILGNTNQKLLDFQLITEGFIIEDIYQLFSHLLSNKIITTDTEAKNYWEEVLNVFNLQINLNTLTKLFNAIYIKNSIKLFSHFIEIQDNNIINENNKHYYPEFFQKNSEELKVIIHSILQERSSEY